MSLLCLRVRILSQTKGASIWKLSSAWSCLAQKTLKNLKTDYFKNWLEFILIKLRSIKFLILLL